MPWERKPRRAHWCKKPWDKAGELKNQGRVWRCWRCGKRWQVRGRHFCSNNVPKRKRWWHK